MSIETVWAMGLTVSSGAASCLPPWARYAMARGLGKGIGRLFPSKWEAVKKNLSHVRAATSVRFSTDRVFRNFGVTLADFLSGRSVETVVEGRDRVEAARAEGRGVMILTTHLGNWELGARVLSRWGWPVTAVYRAYDSIAMRNFIQSRRPTGLTYLAVGNGAAHGVVKALRRREAVAMVADRPFGEEGGWVRLLGRTVRWPRGPFLLAARSMVPIVPGFAIMEKPGCYRVIMGDALKGEGPDPVQNLMDKMAQVLGEYIARYGDQWYCFEPVWEDPLVSDGKNGFVGV